MLSLVGSTRFSSDSKVSVDGEGCQFGRTQSLFSIRRDGGLQKSFLGGDRLRSVWWLVLSIFITCFFSGCGGDGSITKDGKKKLTLSKSYPYPGVHKQIPIRKKKTTGDKSTRNGASVGNGKDKKKKAETEDDRKNFLVKPFHWTMVQTKAQSEENDFNGRFAARFFSIEKEGTLGTNYVLKVDRQAGLAKGQPKNLTIPVLPGDEGVSTLEAKLSSISGYKQAESFTVCQALRDYQYNFLVLSKSPDSFAFMKSIPSIRNMKFNERLISDSGAYGDTISEDGELMDADDPRPEDSLQPMSMYYRLVFSNWKDRAEVPSNSLQWTSVAYLMWVDYDPGLLSEDQKTAILDWLNFGGQIIVTGESVEQLRGSFLEPYLPLTIQTIENRSLADLQPLMEFWSDGLEGARTSPGLSEQKQMPIWVGNVTEGSQFVEGSNQLVVQKPIGKGRIVCVRFPFGLKELRSWDGFDNWFNHALLSRPGRIFDYGDSSDTLDRHPFFWKGDQRQPEDPYLYTSYRSAAHDWSYQQPPWLVFRNFLSEGKQRIDDNRLVGDSLARGSKNANSFHQSESFYYSGLSGRTPGQWEEDSAFALAGKTILSDYSGIVPPRRNWVLFSLLIYIAVLVPLNYVVFRLAGKVEWAWGMVPVIAIGSGIVVVRAASLDIGFSNKMVQVNVLEIPAGYSRGQLTGYGSVYSSLSQFFRFQSENSTTLVVPLSIREKEGVNSSLNEFQYEYSLNPKFGPLQVPSNDTDYFQYQQMVDLGNGLKLEGDAESGFQLTNGTPIDLNDSLIVWNDPKEDPGNFLSYFFVKELKAGDSIKLTFLSSKNYFDVVKPWVGTPMEDYSVLMRQVLSWLNENFSDKLDQLEVTEITRVLSERFPKVGSEFENYMMRYQAKDDNVISRLRAIEKAVRRSELKDEIRMGDLAYQAVFKRLRKDEMRMISWSEGDVSQLEIQPAPTQLKQRTFVVSQLKAPQRPRFSQDKNLAVPKKKEAANAAEDGNGGEVPEKN